MGFNQAIKDMKSSGERFGVFQSNVKVKHFTGDGVIAFRILPSYAYVQGADGKPVPAGPSAWMPYRHREAPHDFTEWGNTILLSRGVGHGKDYKSGARKDILSPKTFNPDAIDPLTMLYDAAAAYPEWQYLIEDQKAADGKTVIQRAALTKPGKLLLMNVVDVGDPQVSGMVQVGCFTKSSYDSLFSGNGLAVAPSAYPVTPQQLADNFCVQWAYGDITDPNYGPVLLCIKGKGQGNFSKYNITLAVDSQNQVKRWPMNETYLQQRYDMNNLPSIVVQENEQQIIGTLCKLLNMRGPHGRHEWHLLKDVFGAIAQIPNPPENAPMATATIQSGFQQPQGAPGGFVPPQGGPGGFAPPQGMPGGFIPPGGMAPPPSGFSPGGMAPPPPMQAPLQGQQPIQYGPAPIQAPSGMGGFAPAAPPPMQGPPPMQPQYAPAAPQPAGPPPGSPPPMQPQYAPVQPQQQPPPGSPPPTQPQPQYAPAQPQQQPDQIPYHWPQQQQQPQQGPVTAAAIGPAMAAAQAAPQQPVTPPPQQQQPPQQSADPNQQIVPGTGKTRAQFLAEMRTVPTQ